MIPVTPQEHQEGGRLVIYAEDQPEYLPLPVSKTDDGVLMSEWEPTPEERAVLAAGGRIRIFTHTYNKPLQPFSVEAVVYTGRTVAS